jgi:hypothetical protein
MLANEGRLLSVNDQPYQNTPSGTPPPPGPGYTYYPDNNAQVPPVAPQGYQQQVYQQPGYQQQEYQQPGYQQPNMAYPMYPGAVYVQPDSRRGMAITGFILGLISLFLWVLFSGAGAVINIFVFILGIIFSALGMRSRSLKGLAIAGLVLSIIGALITIVIFIIGIIVASQSGSFSY